jgi:uncharacterized protein (UPF0128 family)
LHVASERSGPRRVREPLSSSLLVCFVFGRRERRGDFEIADAGQFGQDLILNAVSEISVGFFLAQVLERQYSDRFSGVLALGPELV